MSEPSSVIRVGGEGRWHQQPVGDANDANLEATLARSLDGQSQLSSAPQAPLGANAQQLEGIGSSDEHIPEDLVCPITGQIFTNPVSGPDLVPVERSAILDWLEKNPLRPNPFNGCELTADQLQECPELKKRAGNFVAAQFATLHRFNQHAGRSPNSRWRRHPATSFRQIAEHATSFKPGLLHPAGHGTREILACYGIHVDSASTVTVDGLVLQIQQNGLLALSEQQPCQRQVGVGAARQ